MNHDNFFDYINRMKFHVWFQLMVHFNSIDPWILDEKILAQILADLYFNAPPKHPLRGILAKYV